ncbi:MAG: flagellar biosynthetic protein FliR [Acidimicrobiales bacterium]
MTVPVDAAWLVALLLATARAVAWLCIVPPFANRQVIPTPVTIAVGLGLGLLVAPGIPSAALPQTTAGLVGSLVLQVMTGAALGFVINLLLSAITTAGSMLDLGGGLTLPPSEDPLSLQQTPIMGQFYEQVAVLLLFASGGYLVIVQGFVHSFATPAYSLAGSGRVATVVTTDLATFFTSALEIACPILAILFGAQIVLAMLAKAAPQVNVWILGFPLQVFLVLVLAAVGISVIPGYLGNLLTRALGDGARMFGG